MQRKMTDAFLEEASAVMNSPYWSASSVGGSTPAQHVALVQQRTDEKDELLSALERATDYSSLQGKARAIYDRARSAIRG